MHATPPFTFNGGTRDLFEANLVRHQAKEIEHEVAAAAVAVTLVDQNGQAAFVITRRADHLHHHAGQWALPGGRIDAGETAEQAALRELQEEVDADVAGDAILGRLDDYQTRSGFVITPVVVWAEGVDMTPNPDEVAEIHRVPIADLDRPDSPRFVTIAESERPVIQMPLVGTLLHAPTAAILFQFREVAMRGLSTRVAHLEQPVWAWR
ncbi:MAG TPA: CoA pyrophosphatase [Actinobacteria bacterium]|nr:CoA pyrophosphatase [Actinomycetota bacterium]